jgi:hypothetical protein
VTDPGSAGSCQVTLLIPHSERRAVLVADVESFTPGTPPTLPTLRMSSAEPKLSDILDLVDVVDTATTPVLRLVVTSGGEASDTLAGDGNEVSLVLEFDAATTDPPAGWTWQELSAEVLAQLEPESSRAAFASWARERADGWSPLRPPWSRPGWFASASKWMVDQMTAEGRPAISAPQQHQLWGASIVLRASSANGDVFFKCSPELFRHEAAMTKALAELMPERLPEVIAVDGDRGWMLMRDFRAAELGDLDPSLWHEGVVTHAGIQMSWLGRTDELLALGLPVRSLKDLALEVEAMTEDPVLLERMTADTRGQWLATAPALAESCRRLDEIGPGTSLVHGDLHPWNIAYGHGTTRVFDWTDAAVSHPFVDLATYVLRTEDTAVRRRVMDAYIDAWSAVHPEDLLREAAALALEVGALYQVQTYRILLPTLMQNGADDGLAVADLGWIKISLKCHEHGLDNPA